MRDGLLGEASVQLLAAPEEVVGVDDAEHQVGVGDRGFGAARRRSRPGQGGRLRCAGRPAGCRRRRPRRSRHRRADGVHVTIGTFIWYWLSTVVVVLTGSPSTIMPTRNVVPPMSVEMTLPWPSWRPRLGAADQPAGEHRADRGDARGPARPGGRHAPPEPCMTSSEPGEPAGASCARAGSGSPAAAGQPGCS